jgi:hypothetical protein
MKKIIVLAILGILLLSVFVSANGIPCDPNDPECPEGTTCVLFEEGYQCIDLVQAQGQFNVWDMLIRLAISGNLMKEKILLVLHVIQEQTTQNNLMQIEKILSTLRCDQLPFSFGVSNTYYTYGKLNEVDKLVNSLIVSTSEDPEKFGITQAKLDQAESYLELSESWINVNQRYALNCKYWAYQLLLNRDINPLDPLCLCPEVR